MQKTKIEWTDMSWNPVTGCKHDCEYCYAKAISKKFKRSWKPTFHEKRIKQPLFKDKSQRIFVCSMADLFGDWVPDEWIERVLYYVKLCKQHTFQFLTKNPERYFDFEFTKNCWLGVSATDQKMFDHAMNVFNDLDVNVKYLSCEPLLGQIEMYGVVDWLIIGACSNPKPCQPEREWVVDMIDYAGVNNIPVFLKPNLQVVDHTLFKEFPVSSNVEVQETLF